MTSPLTQLVIAFSYGHLPGHTAYPVGEINTPLFVTVANVMAEWLVPSCNTHLHLADPLLPWTLLVFMSGCSSALPSVSLAFTELWWIYGLINGRSPRLSSSIGPYVQPLNLKGGHLSGPYVAACPVSQYWVGPVPKSVDFYFRSSLAYTLILLPFSSVMQDSCVVSCQSWPCLGLVALYEKQYFTKNEMFACRMTHWFPVKCHVNTGDDKFVLA